MTGFCSMECEMYDLDLVILQNPKEELKKAIENARLDIIVRIIKFIEQGKIDLKIFAEKDLLKKAADKEAQNNRYSKKYRLLQGIICSAIAAVAFCPSGGGLYGVMNNGEYFLRDPQNANAPLYHLNFELNWDTFEIKCLYLIGFFMILEFARYIKSSCIKHAHLVNELVKKYHVKSLDIAGQKK